MSNDKNIFERLLKLWVMIMKMIIEGVRDPYRVADYLQRIVDPSSPPIEPIGCYIEKNGIIRFNVTPTGWSGPEWEKFCDENGYELSDDARRFLNSPDFKPTLAGKVVQVAVLKGELFADNVRTTENIRAKARKLKLKKGNHDLACLVRKELTNEELVEMGLFWIIGMSDTIEVSGGDPGLLAARWRDSRPWLGAYDGEPDGRWGREDGFAFEEPQVRRPRS